MSVTNGMLLWAGTQEGYEAHVEAQKQIEAQLPSIIARAGDEEIDESSFLLKKAGSVGVIAIRGGINSNMHWYDKYIDAASYPAIQGAIYTALADPDIRRIVLLVDSNGGHVNGVSDTAALIRMASRQKTIVTVAGGNMSSAAYWMGSSASKVFASPTSMVGSIGVLLIHADHSKRLEDLGVKYTAVRSTEGKALGQPFEPMAGKALVEYQALVSALYGVFLRDVAANRNRSEDYFRSGPGQGQVYVGQMAVDQGLVDGIASVNDIIGRTVAGEFDTSEQSPQNPTYFIAQTQQGEDMTPEQQAALAAAQALGASATAGTATDTQTTPPAATGSGTSTDTKPAAAAGTNDAASAGTNDAAAPVADSAISVLTAQITEQATALASATAELNALKAKAEADSKTTAALAAIVGQAVANMQVGLGQSPGDYSAMDPNLLVAEHARVTTTFLGQFKVGGVSATQVQTTAESSKAETNAIPDYLRPDRVQAATTLK